MTSSYLPKVLWSKYQHIGDWASTHEFGGRKRKQNMIIRPTAHGILSWGMTENYIDICHNQVGKATKLVCLSIHIYPSY